MLAVKKRRTNLESSPQPVSAGSQDRVEGKVPLALGDLAVGGPLHFETWLSAELGRQGAMQDLGWKARDGGDG
jgi:hypothetical protein